MKWVFGADTTPFRRGLDQMRSETKSFAGSVKGQLAAAFGFTAIIAGFKKVIGLASDLGESVSKSRQIFANNSKDVESWAGSLAKSFGQSKAQALEAATSFGAVFNVLGIGKKESAEMSKSLVELASDMASFNNTSVDDALTAIGAGLRGEAEPLRRFAVLLDDATLKQKAMEMGLYSGTGSLSVQQKSMAAYEVILEQTASAQGDFARTSEGAANSQRILAAEAENAGAEIGNSLLPVYERLLASLKDAETVKSAKYLGAAIQLLIISFEALFGTFALVVRGIYVTVTGLLSEMVSGIGDFGSILANLLSGNFSGAEEAASRFSSRFGNAMDVVRDEVEHTGDAIKAFAENLGKTPDVEIGMSAEDEEQILKVTQERMKLAEEIAKLEEEAKERSLSLAEKILKLEKERAELIYQMEGTSDETESLKNKKGMLEADKELAKLREDQAKEEDKSAKEIAEKKQDMADKITAAQEKEAEQERDIRFNNSSDLEKVGILREERDALLEKSRAAGESGDKLGEIENRTAATAKDAERNDLLASLMDAQEGVLPTIATSSLAAIGAGGSANLIGTSTGEQQQIDLLRVIAENTAKGESGNGTLPDPI